MKHESVVVDFSLPVAGDASGASITAMASDRAIVKCIVANNYACTVAAIDGLKVDVVKSVVLNVGVDCAVRIGCTH